MKKVLPYILILIILVGLFSPLMQVWAQEPAGNCVVTYNVNPIRIVKHPAQPGDKESNCSRYEDAINNTTAAWEAGTPVAGPTDVAAPSDPNKTGLNDPNNRPGCILFDPKSGTVGGCLVEAAFWLVYVLPSQLMALAGWFFDAMVGITLSSVVFSKAAFIPDAWRIIRDFSNIFFILILLYTAIKMILDLGGSQAKKIIVNVIIIALLINFSMFFTQVVIDASNILALIFYNKITVNVTNDNKAAIDTPVFKQSETGVEQKSISYALVSGFNPSKVITDDIFKSKKGETSSWNTLLRLATLSIDPGGDIANHFAPSGQPEIGFYLTVIIVSGAIFLYAAWAFFIAGFAFLGRLIELWLCIIFAPFAFLSFAVPQLEKVDYLGWDSWLKRLMMVAFMAPLFLFFMLVISKIIKTPIFSPLMNNNFGTTEGLLIVVIPALIILTLLHKATAFAKKGAGEFGEAAIKYGSVAAAAVGGLALGAASGGTSLALTSTLGRAGSAIANSEFAKTNGAFGRGIGNIGKWAGTRSFDLRKAPGAASLAKATGMNLESSKIIGLGTQEGGFIEARKKKDEKRRKRAQELKVSENEPLKQKLNSLEEDSQELKSINAGTFERLDKSIEAARIEANDLNTKGVVDPIKVEARRIAIENAANTTYATPEEKTAAIAAAQAMDVNDPAKVKAKKDIDDKLEELKTHKKAIREGHDIFKVTSLTDNTLQAAYNAGDPQVTFNATTQRYEKTINFVDPTTGKNQNKITNKADGIERSIADLDIKAIPDAMHEIKEEDRARLTAFAKEIRNAGLFRRTFLSSPTDTKAAREATAHAIIMDVKLPDSAAKTH